MTNPHEAWQPGFESMVRRLNDILGPAVEESYTPDLPDRIPPLHVIGVPRTGTTLATQLVTSHLTVTRIDRLAAVFWRAPTIGLELSRRLLGRRVESTYESRFGATDGIAEPHEFGAFWRELLGYEAMEEDPARVVDWARVRLVLTNMLEAAGEPIVFKAFLVAWHMREMSATLPLSCYLWTRRDPRDTAISIAMMRQVYGGSLDAWVSMKPAAAADLASEPWWVQVAAQVFHVDQAIEKGASEIGAGNLLRVDYETMCAEPGAVVASVADLLTANGAEVTAVGSPPKRFEPAVPALRDHRHLADLEAALRMFYG